MADMPTADPEKPSELNSATKKLAAELSATARADAASSSSSVPMHTTNSGDSNCSSSPQTGSRRLFLAELKRAAGLTTGGQATTARHITSPSRPEVLLQAQRAHSLKSASRQAGPQGLGKNNTGRHPITDAMRRLMG